MIHTQTVFIFVVLFSILVEMLLEGQDAQNLRQGGTDDSEMDPSFP